MCSDGPAIERLADWNLFYKCVYLHSPHRILVTSIQRKENIESIRSLPERARQAVATLSDAQLDTPYRIGGWTPRQVIHHLADSHMNAFIRMKLILTEDNPTLRPYNQDEWAKLPDTVTMPVESSLMLLANLHERWSILLESVKEEQWARAAIHPDSGKVTLDSLLTTYARHGEKHVEQIMSLRRLKGWL